MPLGNQSFKEGIMYKVVLVHEIIPGKLSDFKRWFRDADEKRKARNPNYTPPNRYITVIGTLTRVVLEWEYETVPDHPFVWSEGIETQGDLKDIVVPGMSEGYVLKEIH
jgi:hypothetical protein